MIPPDRCPRCVSDAESYYIELKFSSYPLPTLGQLVARETCPTCRECIVHAFANAAHELYKLADKQTTLRTWVRELAMLRAQPFPQAIIALLDEKLRSLLNQIDDIALERRAFQGFHADAPSYPFGLEKI